MDLCILNILDPANSSKVLMIDLREGRGESRQR